MDFKKNYFQWDINQHIPISEKYCDFVINGEVYRLNSSGGIVKIPDECFLTSGRKFAYICYENGTKQAFSFNVTARPMPPGFVYTETEKITFDALVEEVNALVADLVLKVETGYFDGKDYVITESDYDNIADVAKEKLKPELDSKATKTALDDLQRSTNGRLLNLEYLSNLDGQKIFALEKKAHEHANKNILDQINQVPLFEHQDVSDKATKTEVDAVKTDLSSAKDRITVLENKPQVGYDDTEIRKEISDLNKDLDLKEAKSNKVASITDSNNSSDEKYPSVNAVVKYVESHGGGSAVDQVARDGVSRLSESITEISEVVDTNLGGGKTYVPEYETIAGETIQASTSGGYCRIATSSAYTRTDYIPINHNDLIAYSYTGLNPTMIGAFFREDKTGIVGSQFSATSETKTAVAPSEAKYLVISAMASRFSNFTFAITTEKKGKIKEELVGLDKRVSDLEKRPTPSSASVSEIKPLFVEMQTQFWGGTRMANEMSGKNCEFVFDCSEGDTVVTVKSASPVQLSDIASFTGWMCGWITFDDVIYDICNFKRISNTEIEIYPPMKKTATDVKVGNAIYDGGASYVGMHLSENGYKAYAQCIYNANPKYCEIGAYIESYNCDGDDNPPFTIYKDSGAGNLYEKKKASDNRDPHWFKHWKKVRYAVQFAASYAPYEKEAGVKWSGVDVSGKKGYLETFINLSANVQKLPDGQELYVELWLDGELKEQEIIFDSICHRVVFDYENAQTAEMRAYCKKWAPVNNGSITINIGRTTWWVTENDYSGKLIPDYAVVAQEFDSWGVFHDGASGKELSRLIKESSKVYVPYENHSKGSQTSAWGKGWFYENVWKYHPDIAIFDFVINDKNSVGSSSIPSTVEGSDGTIYNNKITKEEYCENMKALIDMSIASGIQPIIVMATQQGDAGYDTFSDALIEYMSHKLE